MEKKGARAGSWRIVGLRTSGAVVLRPANRDLEIEDSEVGSLTIEDDDATDAEDEPPGVLGDGVRQIAWMVAAAGATRFLGIG